MPSAGFEPVIPASEWKQTYAGVATGFDWHKETYTERHGGKRDGRWTYSVKLLVVLLAFV